MSEKAFQDGHLSISDGQGVRSLHCWRSEDAAKGAIQVEYDHAAKVPLSFAYVQAMIICSHTAGLSADTNIPPLSFAFFVNAADFPSMIHSEEYVLFVGAHLEGQLVDTLADYFTNIYSFVPPSARFTVPYVDQTIAVLGYHIMRLLRAY